MSDMQSCLIYVTGVVGRSMGSGKFASSDMLDLTRNAYAAFCDVFGKPEAQSLQRPNPHPSASQWPQKPDWKTGAAELAGGGNGIAPEPMSFDIWGGDRAYIFGDNNKLWATWLAEAQEGNEKSIKALENASKAGLGDDPKWHKANAKRIARAKACLGMLKQG